MHRLRVFALAWALAFLPALVVAAPRAPSQQTIDADIENWVKAEGEWGQSFRAVQKSELTLVSEVIAGTTMAKRYYASHDRAGGTEWAANWATEHRAEATALSAAISALNAEPPPLPAYAMAIPKYASLFSGYQSFGRVAVADFRQVPVLVSDLIALVEKAAGGDEAAENAMDARAIDGSISLIQAEISMLTATAVAGGEAHPQTAVARSGIEVDGAIISLLRFRRDRLTGKALAPATYAAEIRQHADAMAADADRIEPTAAAMLKQANQRGTLPVALRERLDRAFATYHDSADLDRALVLAVRAMGALVADGDADSVKMKSATAEIAATARKAQALELLRSQILAGQP